MEPLTYMQATGASYSDLAALCARDYSEVCRWFSQAKTARRPTARDLRILELDYQLRVERGEIHSIDRGLLR